MLTTAAALALFTLLPEQHPLRRRVCRVLSAIALSGALRLPRNKATPLRHA